MMKVDPGESAGSVRARLVSWMQPNQAPRVQLAHDWLAVLATGPVPGHAKRTPEAGSVDTRNFLVSIGPGCRGAAHLGVRYRMREQWCGTRELPNSVSP